MDKNNKCKTRYRQADPRVCCAYGCRFDVARLFTNGMGDGRTVYRAPPF